MSSSRVFSLSFLRVVVPALLFAGCGAVLLAGCESPPPPTPPDPDPAAVAPAAPTAPQQAEFLRDTERPPEWMLVRIGLVADADGTSACRYSTDTEFSIHRGGGLTFGAFGTPGAVSINGSDAFTTEGTSFQAELEDFFLVGPDALVSTTIRADAAPGEQYEVALFCVVDGQRVRATSSDGPGTRGGPIIIIENGDRGHG